MAGDRTQEKVLVEMVAPRKIVAADQVGIFAFEIDRRPDRSGQHEAAQARRVSLQDVEHAFGIGFLRIVPIRRANLALGVAANLGWQNSDLHPEDMLAFRSARGVDRGGLADDQRGLDGKQSGRRFGIGPRHHFKVRRDMDVGEALQDRSSAPVGQSVKRQVYHHRARTRPECRNVAFEFFTGGIGSDQCSENELRMHVSNDRAPHFEVAPIRQGHPAGASGTDVDPRNGNAEDQRRAARF